MPDSDLAVRLAAFAFLDEQRRLHPDGLPRAALQQGFIFSGDRVPLVGPQGIFKPRVCELPLSVTTVAIADGETRPYDDTFGEDVRAAGIDMRGLEGWQRVLICNRASAAVGVGDR